MDERHPCHHCWWRGAVAKGDAIFSTKFASPSRFHCLTHNHCLCADDSSFVHFTFIYITSCLLFKKKGPKLARHK